MNFKQHRVSNNLTQEQVAQDVGVQRTTVAMWESGKSRPRAELLPKLAKLFGCMGIPGRRKTHGGVFQYSPGNHTGSGGNDLPCRAWPARR